MSPIDPPLKSAPGDQAYGDPRHRVVVTRAVDAAAALDPVAARAAPEVVVAAEADHEIILVAA